MRAFKRLVRIAAGACLLLLCACASGPTFSQWSASAPQLSAEKGRVFIYRESDWVAAGAHPSMYIDDVKVGDSVAGGFIFVDVKPGAHVFTSWPVNIHRVDFSVAAGQTAYVKMTLQGPNLQFEFPVPVLVDNATGEKEVVECLYIGK